ncbi:type IV secretory system conjugative DNA transfer family protein [Rhodococcus sp. UNC23MFCrub1.1]|uniref:type IV secretory system conjugative DNA transfer family protein n=1 Tax=Rhodococcus sp. UNC23MFCrub1.1 TaxID=1449068 RepID=UPI0005646B59|nr:TraM recognition domain-containing protein [Rhodococcus sp. UNC23MFCrub1.1]
MTARTTSSAGSSIGETIALIVLTLAVVGALITLGAWWFGAALTGIDTSPNPLIGAFDAVRGRRPWPWQSTVLAAFAGSAVLVLTVAAVWRWARGRTSVDAAAKTMVHPGKLSGVSRSASQKLVPQFDKKDSRSWGFLIGYTVRGNVPVYLTWEMVMVAIAGMRMGKTVALAIRAVLAAPGPAIVNSTKPDLHAATRLGRERHGQVHMLDLQRICGTRVVTFWWNPLKRVREMGDARRVASFFVSGSSTKGATTSNYFDGGSADLLALYLLAAAAGGGDMLHAVHWLGRDQDSTPAQILDATGHPEAANAIRTALRINPRQRDGLYDMARKCLNVLVDKDYADVVTPPRRTVIEARTNPETGAAEIRRLRGAVHHDRPEFDPHKFVTSTDTLYTHSNKGAGPATPLVTALLGQIFDAGITIAVRNPSRSYPAQMPGWWPQSWWRPSHRAPEGRLEVPLVAVLDEVANTVLLEDLPDQYSYFGSHGIIPIAILQNPQQGQKSWGREEFDGMMSNAVHFYGGGTKDRAYVQGLSDVVGTHEVQTTSHSRGRSGVSTSQSWQERPILPVHTLAAMPSSRALVTMPGNPPVLIKKLPWWETDDKALIEESIGRYAGSEKLRAALLTGLDDDDLHPTQDDLEVDADLAGMSFDKDDDDTDEQGGW